MIKLELTMDEYHALMKSSFHYTLCNTHHWNISMVDSVIGKTAAAYRQYELDKRAKLMQIRSLK